MTKKEHNDLETVQVLISKKLENLKKEKNFESLIRSEIFYKNMFTTFIEYIRKKSITWYTFNDEKIIKCFGLDHKENFKNNHLNKYVDKILAKKPSESEKKYFSIYSEYLSIAKELNILSEHCDPEKLSNPSYFLKSDIINGKITNEDLSRVLSFDLESFKINNKVNNSIKRGYANEDVTRFFTAYAIAETIAKEPNVEKIIAKLNTFIEKQPIFWLTQMTRRPQNINVLKNFKKIPDTEYFKKFKGALRFTRLLSQRYKSLKNDILESFSEELINHLESFNQFKKQNNLSLAVSFFIMGFDIFSEF